MPRRKRIEIALPDIKTAFSKQAVWSMTQVREVLAKKAEHWKLPSAMGSGKFLTYMIEHTSLNKIVMDFPHRRETRYTWGDVAAMTIACSLKPNGYFSHYTAMSEHGLTDQIPKIIYLNTEQSPKPQNPHSLSQDKITRAFQRPPRQTKNRAQCGNMEICLLNGMHTDRLGVIPLQSSAGKGWITGIERTLIDIATRPFQAGGVHEILRAYKAAKGKVDVVEMEQMLQKMNYVYPYHQVLGFYLERAKYPKEDIALFDGRKNFDFYLTYGIKKPKIDSRWRLFYPEGL